MRRGAPPPLVAGGLGGAILARRGAVQKVRPGGFQLPGADGAVTQDPQLAADQGAANRRGARLGRSIAGTGQSSTDLPADGVVAMVHLGFESVAGRFRTEPFVQGPEHAGDPPAQTDGQSCRHVGMAECVVMASSMGAGRDALPLGMVIDGSLQTAEEAPAGHALQ